MSQTLEGHIVQRFDGEMGSLHKLIIEMGELVLTQVQAIAKSLKEEEPDLARETIIRDQEVDEMELEADDQVISLIARRAPVARDLRGIMALSKTISDLEKIGDEVCKIAAAIITLYDGEEQNPSYELMRDVRKMAKLAAKMLRQALKSLDALDLELAEELTDEDYDLAAEFQTGLRHLMTFIMQDSRNIGHAVHAVVIIKALERIGEYSGNLADYVIFIVKGIDIRHKHVTDWAQG